MLGTASPGSGLKVAQIKQIIYLPDVLKFRPSGNSFKRPHPTRRKTPDSIKTKIYCQRSKPRSGWTNFVPTFNHFVSWSNPPSAAGHAKNSKFDKHPPKSPNPNKKTESAIKLIHFFDVGRPTGKKFRHCDDSIFRPAARVNFAGDVSIKLGLSCGRVGWRFGWKKRTGDELTKVDSFDGSKV